MGEAMNRRKFLQGLGIGAVIAPFAKFDAKEPVKKPPVKLVRVKGGIPKRKGSFSSLPEHFITDYEENWRLWLEQSPSRLYVSNMQKSANKKVDENIFKAFG